MSLTVTLTASANFQIHSPRGRSGMRRSYFGPGMTSIGTGRIFRHAGRTSHGIAIPCFRTMRTIRLRIRSSPIVGRIRCFVRT